MKNPIISVIIPVYNGERYLPEAIESCIAQTFQEWELIIVDDCSTDRTPEIIRKYTSADARIRSVRHKENRKLPASLNTGFNLAKGEYLTWTSDDNRYRPDALAVLLRNLESRPEIAVVYSDFAKISNEGHFVEECRVPNPEDLVYCNAVGPSFLYRRRVLESVGQYDESLFLVEDYEYWLRVAQSFRLYPLHEVLYDYRLHSTSLTTMRKREIREKYFLLLQSHLPMMGWAGSVKIAEGYAILTKKAVNDEFYSLAWQSWIKSTRRSSRIGIPLFLYLVKKMIRKKILT